MSRLEKALLHLSSWAAAITGAAYFWMKYMMRPRDEFSVVNHPWQPHLLALHVLAVPVLVFALGLIARAHVVERYREDHPRASRGSGLLTVLLGAPMIASGYLVQVLTGPGPRRAAAFAHAAAGGLFALAYLLHLAGARPEARRAARARAAHRLAGAEDRDLESQRRSRRGGPNG